MKRILIVFGLVAFVALTALSFLPGFGPDPLDYEDESTGNIGPLSYFKTPQSAVQTTSGLLQDRNWKKLSQFFDQKDSDTRYEDLADGSYYRIDSQDRSLVRPFAPEYDYLEIIGTEHEDVYEVVVGKVTEADGPAASRFFYLKRYPEGYRILTQRPASQQPGSN